MFIHNAATVGEMKYLWECDERVWVKDIQINVGSLLPLVRPVIRRMIRQKKGTVVFLTSGASVRGRPKWGMYCSAKAALERFAESLAEGLREAGHAGVRVLLFNPEPTRTKMRAAAYPQEDPATLKTPEKAAEAIRRLVEADGFPNGGLVSYSEIAR